MNCPGGERRPTLDAIINDELELASLPEVFHRIVSSINDPKTSASHIAEVVSMDPSLSARLLRLVNSPYYGFAEKVDTLSRALALVGTDKLVNLALGISAVNAFKDISVDLFDMRSFWEHSVTCALTASWLAERVPGASEESYFVSGLLHDLGWLVMLKLHPEASCEVLCKQKIDHRPGYRIEKEMWGFDHAELGGMVLREWGLPPGPGSIGHAPPLPAHGQVRPACLAHPRQRLFRTRHLHQTPEDPGPAPEARGLGRPAPDPQRLRPHGHAGGRPTVRNPGSLLR